MPINCLKENAMQRTILNETSTCSFSLYETETKTEIEPVHLDTDTEIDKQPDAGSGLLGGLLGGLFSKPTQNQVNQNVSYTHNISAY